MHELGGWDGPQIADTGVTAPIRVGKCAINHDTPDSLNPVLAAKNRDSCDDLYPESTQLDAAELLRPCLDWKK